MSKLTKPWLLLDPERAHRWAPKALKILSKFRDYKTLTWKPFTWNGLEFNNPLGIAGGIDKNAVNITDWWTWGCGFIEVGTVTPKPQIQNEGEVIARDIEKRLLWNRLGFPNEGMNVVHERLTQLSTPHFTPIFVNIGKNRDTPNETAHSDYIQLIEKLNDVADAFVINISSPNTTGLRELLEPENLKKFLSPIFEKSNTFENPTPILLKLSPDIESDDLKRVIDISIEFGIGGWVLTNTTLQRPSGSTFPQTGGLSGKFLNEISENFLLKTIEHLGEKKSSHLVVSAGGVLTPEDVFRRIEIGAHLVQIYTALIFEGPYFFQRTADQAHIRYALHY